MSTLLYGCECWNELKASPEKAALKRTTPISWTDKVTNKQEESNESHSLHLARSNFGTYCEKASVGSSCITGKSTVLKQKHDKRGTFPTR